MGIVGFVKMLMSWSKKPSILPENGRWQVSDFDYFMRGNPHDLEGMKTVYGKVPITPPLEEKK